MADTDQTEPTAAEYSAYLELAERASASETIGPTAVRRMQKLEAALRYVVRTIDRMDYGLDSVLEIARRAQVESIDPDPLCGVAWGKVAYMCGLGSTSAVALCVEFGVDPNHDCSHDAEEALNT